MMHRKELFNLFPPFHNANGKFPSSLLLYFGNDAHMDATLQGYTLWGKHIKILMPSEPAQVFRDPWKRRRSFLVEQSVVV